MVWIPVIAWIVALALALVVLGFCAYELHWKARRLRTEASQLQHCADELTRIQARASALADDLARVRTGLSRR